MFKTTSGISNMVSIQMVIDALRKENFKKEEDGVKCEENACLQSGLFQLHNAESGAMG